MTLSVGEMRVPASRKVGLFNLNSSRMSEAAFAYLLIIPVVIVLVAIMIYPTIYSLWMSFHYIDVGSGAWEWVGLDNYTYALGNADLRSSILRTVLYTVYVTTFASLLAIGGALRLTILICLVLVTAEAAKVFDIIYFISGGGPGKSSLDLVYEIYVESFTNWQFGYGAAISWILVVLIMSITTLYFMTIMRRERQ